MLSVVVPCYNEEEGIEEFHRRMTAVLSAIDTPYELIFVNDGSEDGTHPLLLSLAMRDSHLVVVDLARNFGHQFAVSAGLEIATGQAVVTIDADLQDPPEVIVQMYDLWREGYQVVYAVRDFREGESGLKLWTAKLFYRIINRLSDVKIPLDTGDFRLVDRCVINVLVRMPERHRLLRAMYSWIGFRQIGLHYRRAPRFAGKTKYPLGKMISLALDGIVSFSIIPLRMLTVAGLLAALLSICGILYALVVRTLTHSWVAGWATLFICMLFLSGLQMTSLGIIGEYIGRIYTEVKQRPLHIVAAIYRAGDPPPLHPNSPGLTRNQV